MKAFRTALITGGSTGIGAALARALAARGARVAICGRRQDVLDATVKELGAEAVGYRVDVSNPDEVVQMVEEASRDLDGLDLVVANAGFGGNRSAKRLRPEHFVSMMATNATGAMTTLTAAIPHMIERGRGHLVGVSSLAAYRGLPTSAAYSASKAALSIFLESLRVDLNGTGITVTDVRPGFIQTPLTDDNDFPMPFMISADDAAQRILRAAARGRRVYAFPWQTALVRRGGSSDPRNTRHGVRERSGATRSTGRARGARWSPGARSASGLRPGSSSGSDGVHPSGVALRSPRRPSQPLEAPMMVPGRDTARLGA